MGRYLHILWHGSNGQLVIYIVLQSVQSSLDAVPDKGSLTCSLKFSSCLGPNVGQTSKRTQNRELGRPMGISMILILCLPLRAHPVWESMPHTRAAEAYLCNSVCQKDSYPFPSARKQVPWECGKGGCKSNRRETFEHNAERLPKPLQICNGRWKLTNLQA